MVLGFGDLRKGMTIELEGVPYQVVEYSSHKMQQRAPVMRIRLRDLRSGRTVERTFQGYDVKLTRARVENRPSQYIYNDGEHHYFMDTETYEQYPITRDKLGAILGFLKEEAEVDLVFYQGDVLSVEIANFAELMVVDTPPGVKGDTAQGGTKRALLETGLTLQVPLFINNGEVIRVDTRNGQYQERVG